MKRIFSTLLVIALAFAMLPTSSVMAADPGPVTTNVVVTPSTVLLNGSATVTATITYTDLASTNKAAWFSLDNGTTWNPMDAVDQAFDELTEDVTKEFTVTSKSVTQVCVSGTELLPLATETTYGAMACTPLTVFSFKGFKPPVRMNVTNKATAGQAIPLKWQLLDGNNKPVKIKALFLGVMSYAVDCTTGAGDSTIAVKENAPGKSGFKFTGGYWHFNWKTPKAYAGTCRKMFVSFDGGQMSPEVMFAFKVKPGK
jgi:hypothetical protein